VHVYYKSASQHINNVNDTIVHTSDNVSVHCRPMSVPTTIFTKQSLLNRSVTFKASLKTIVIDARHSLQIASIADHHCGWFGIGLADVQTELISNLLCADEAWTFSELLRRAL
jgi:hypothetical protein